MDKFDLEIAIDNYFSDRSRSALETLEGLREVRDEIDIKIQALENQIEEDEIGSIG